MCRTTITALAMLLGGAASALAQSSIEISLAGEGFDGPPTFEIFVDGFSVGSASVANAIETTLGERIFSLDNPSSLRESHLFSLAGVPFSSDSSISIALVNDRFEESGQGLDRNLFIYSIAVDGIRIPSDQIGIVWNDVEIDLPLIDGMRPVYASGQLAIVSPPEGGWNLRSATAAVPTPIPRPDGL